MTTTKQLLTASSSAMIVLVVSTIHNIYEEFPTNKRKITIYFNFFHMHAMLRQPRRMRILTIEPSLFQFMAGAVWTRGVTRVRIVKKSLEKSCLISHNLGQK